MSDGAPAECPAAQTPLTPAQPPPATHFPGTHQRLLPKPAAKAAVKRALRAPPHAVSVLGCAGWRRCCQPNASYPKDPPPRTLFFPRLWSCGLLLHLLLQPPPISPALATHAVAPPAHQGTFSHSPFWNQSKALEKCLRHSSAMLAVPPQQAETNPRAARAACAGQPRLSGGEEWAAAGVHRQVNGSCGCCAIGFCLPLS